MNVMLDQPSGEPGESHPEEFISQPRLKQYYALKDMEDGKLSWKAGDTVRLSNEEAAPYVGGNILMPLYQALKNKVYVPGTPTPQASTETQKEKAKDNQSKNSTEPSSSTDSKKVDPEPTKEKTLVNKLSESTAKRKQEKKSFLQNQDKEKVEEKKADQKTQTDTSETTSFWDKLK